MPHLRPFVDKNPMTKLTKLALGTVQFGTHYGISNKSGQTTQKEAKKIFDFASKNGIDLLDTASAYGNSEEVLGKCGVERFKVVSKFLLTQDEQDIETQLNKSLRNLKVKKLYGYLAHRPMQVINNPELWQKLKQLKEQGKVDKIGFSFNEVREADEMLEKGFLPDLIQVPYNYLDNRFENQMIDLKNQGCEIHTRSAFLQGLFFMDPAAINSFFDEAKPILVEMQKWGHELPGMLLNYCISKPFIDKVVIGLNNVSQLQQNIEGINKNYEILKRRFKINENVLIPSNWPK